MSRPTVSPDWATNANFAAGVNPWNGQANKVQPSSGITAEGFVPQTMLPAEHVNYLLNNHGGWIDYLDGILQGLVGIFHEHFDNAIPATTVDPINTKFFSAGGGSSNLTFQNYGVVQEASTFGVLQHLATANGASQVLWRGPSLYVGTGDFILTMKARTQVHATRLQALATPGFEIGVLDETLGYYLTLNAGSNNTHWAYKHGVVGAPTASSVLLTDGTTALLQIVRTAGILSFAVNGTVISGPGANATDFTNLVPRIFLNGAAPGGAGLEIIGVDLFNLAA